MLWENKLIMFSAVTIAPAHTESSSITVENNTGFNMGNTFIFAYTGGNYVIRGNEPAIAGFT